MIVVNDILTQLYPLLNASGEADLVWWDGAELLEHMDEASDALGSTGAYADYTDADGEFAPIATGAGGASYNLPNNCAAVVDVDLDGSALRRITVADLDALSDTWDTDGGTPSHFVLDETGIRAVRLWPTPDATGTANVIFATWPDIASGTTHRLPSVYGIYYKYRALSAARSKGGEGQELAISSAAGQRAALIEQACRQMFGGVK